MTNLIASAEELLKTRTIPELRDLVYSLENDGNSKITELQVMVGSKYHDFIQSADAIAAMQQKSEFLESNLCRFLQLSEEIVLKTKDLLSRTVNSQSSDSHSVAPLKIYKAVDSQNVWSYLEECDIFNAAKIVAQSKIIIEAYNISKSVNSNGSAESQYRFCRFLSTAALKDIALDSEQKSNENASKLLSGCTSAVFLSQTVLDDARLFLLEGSCSCDEKASTLASVGLISPQGTGQGQGQGSSSGLHRGGLLSIYLEGVDVLLDSAIEGLTHKRNQPSLLPAGKMNKGKGQAAKKTVTQNTAMMGEKLIQAVQILQRTILDVHLLFFKPTPVLSQSQSLSSSSAPATAAQTASLMVPGLVILKQLEFITDIDRILSPLIRVTGKGTQGTAEVALKGEKRTLGFNTDAFLADDKVCTLPIDIRNIFDQWIGRAVLRVGESTRAALEAMDSATEVARLQQRMWLCCTTVNTSAPPSTAISISSIGSGSGIGSGVGSGIGAAASAKPTQVDWEEACMELLAVKRRRTSASAAKGEDKGAGAGAAAASLLWSRVFRLPFMQQVERLLRESCMCVLRGAKGLLLLALAQEGLTIDPNTLTASLTLPSTAKHPGSSSSSSSSSSGMGVGVGYSSANLSVPSPRIFRKAEAVRCLLQEELSDLLRDIIAPVQDGDPESSSGLSRALFIQCSQLSGQLAILLRCLCASITTAIDTTAKAAQPAGRAGAMEKDRGDSDPAAPLLSGLLLVGRLSWLLKIRGRFFEEALSPAPLFTQSSSSSSSSDSSSAYNHDQVSEDQMRSAFEIADTNGDGVLTYTEAVEAVNALAVSDTDTLSSSQPVTGSTNIPFLSPRLSPSLNFNEFALLCAHLMSASACSPVERLKICFDDVLSSAHDQWAKRVVTVFASYLSHSLQAELGIGIAGAAPLGKMDATAAAAAAAAVSGLLQTSVAPFKSTWKSVWVDLDAGDTTDDCREQVCLPTSICTSLSAFLFNLSHCVARSLISVDTVQQLPLDDLFTPSAPLSLSYDDTEERPAPVHRMAHFATTRLYSLAIGAVAGTYASMLKTVIASKEGLAEEDIVLQAIFDLMSCVALEGRCELEQSTALQQCLTGWRARLDPINAEILTPLLTAAADDFSRKTHLLLPGLKEIKAAPALAPPATTSSSSSTGVVNNSASAVSGLFPLNAASRFSLLPLPMSTHFQGSSWVDRNRDKERERDRERGTHAADKQVEGDGGSSFTSSSYAAKSLLGGLSLSQQQHHAEQLGKSLISTWGTFLGSNADKRQGENPKSNFKS